ncbi:uncharacterized protein LOC116019689 [Ipomoea triloba]|uniref:uncharacterized protein LOC116019689 n=1 Tax=Ipomoea triloba TaxID=35885 RepID=UPI00125D00B1|nr:uncharacterized protein LOC116019689 [Ipomoea triloba]
MKTFMTMIMNQMSKLQTKVESIWTQQQSGGVQGSNQASSSSGKLPANTENPRNHVNAITTRSGKALKDPPYPTNDKELEKENEKNESEQEKEEVEIQDILESDNEEEPLIQRDKAKGKAPMQVESNENKKGAPKGKQTHDSVIPCNLLPFPQRLRKSKDTERVNKFKMMLDKLEISMPFVDAVTQIPSYKKFLKDILSNKKKLEKSAVVDMSEGALICAVLQKHLPPKLKDPGSFTIPCIVGEFVVGRALCDLGASVSILPYSLCKRFNLGEPKPTTMTLQMADCSIKRPIGVLEDIPVMIDQYFIPGDFVILDIEEDTKVPIILCRPFLATAGAIIDVKRGKLVMEVAEHKIEFDIFKMTKHQPSYVDECNVVEMIERCVDEARMAQWEEMGELYIEEEEIEEPCTLEDEVEELYATCDPIGEEPPPKVELKPLPPNLRYEFLDSNFSFPVIVNASLKNDEIKKLLDVLKRHRRVIGYEIGDLIGIDQKYCLHRIYLKDDAKPTVEPLRRLNPNLKDVVKKEIMKLLEADVIYPISDSKWVSPIHVVSKKGGMTVIENENNELIPTRLVTGHRMCIDYRKLNKSTRKDHYPLSFIDQLLERMSCNKYFCFLDGFSGYF